MKNIEWLMSGDPIINRLARKYLLDEDVKTVHDGYIQAYLDLYNPHKYQWGGGFYSPKWVSTHYTLLELTDMEMDGSHPIYQDAYQHLFDDLWQRYHQPPRQYLDMCIAGMLLRMASHSSIFNQRTFDMIDYILDHAMLDGGWNCRWSKKDKAKISSVHTTLSILEGLDAYQHTHETYRQDQVQPAIDSGIQCLLDRKLLFKKGTLQALHKDMIHHHYPPRWKYDYLRVLEFLAQRKYPLNAYIEPSLKLLMNHLKHGRLTRGSQIPGKIHFRLEKGPYGRFNTLRAYKVLKHFRPKLFKELLYMDV